MYYYNIIVKFMGFHTQKNVLYRLDFYSPISGTFFKANKLHPDICCYETIFIIILLLLSDLGFYIRVIIEAVLIEIITNKYKNYSLIINNIYKYIDVYIVIVILWSPFIPSRNLDEVFTYNHIWL